MNYDSLNPLSPSTPRRTNVRLTKIVATLGPASIPRIGEMIKAGVNVFRVNFSHCKNGDYSDVSPVIDDIRQVAKSMGEPIAILGDLQGPKFRIGELVDHTPVKLVKGKELLFTVGENAGSAEHLYTRNFAVIEGLSLGHKVLLDDGALELKVLSRNNGREVKCEVITGGMLGEKKGINVPDIKVDSSLSEKDKQDALFATFKRVDYLALSFVQTHMDVIELREYVQKHYDDKCCKEFEKKYGKRPPGGNESPGLSSTEDVQRKITSLDYDNPSKIRRHENWKKDLPLIISKIEKPQALNDMKEILHQSDGIMVARGDLGVEMKLEKVPVIQKWLIDMANAAEKPVITATQMLQSMINLCVPTRAEVSDVANAVFDGTDAVMLSAESAVGEYPVETVKTMSRILCESERNLPNYVRNRELMEMFKKVVPEGKEESLEFHQTIAKSAVNASKRSHIKSIIVLSYSGLMANRIR